MRRNAVPCFRVTVWDVNSGLDRVAASVESLAEALDLMHVLQQHRPRIEWKRDTADAHEGWSRTTLTSREREEIEAIYLKTRIEMKAAGVPDATIDRIVPLTADGRVPWD